jgi:superfamily II DNA/RNA helicase
VTKNVEHVFYPVRRSQKEQLLVEILRREKPSKVLVFTATRENTSVLALVLRRQRYEVVSLSSLLSQANRERALDAYRRGEFQILVATDVAARGLDILDIDLVVNYDVPMQAEEYVHRIGRTGRAERLGKAVTLVSELDQRRVGEIERLLGHPVQRVELEGFPYETLPAAPRRRGSRSGGRRSGTAPLASARGRRGKTEGRRSRRSRGGSRASGGQ